MPKNIRPLAATPNIMYLIADSIWLFCPSRSRRMATRKYSGKAETSSATTRVMRSTQLTSMASPVTLSVTKR
jgi:hypothetical protein